MPTRVKRTVEKDVSLLKLEQPRFLSVVGNPSNRSGFKVLRKDADGNTALRDLVNVATEKSKKRSDSPALLSLSFPQGLTREEVEELLEAFGMESEYEVRGDSDQFIAYRRNSEELEGVETVDINTGLGYVATIAAQRFCRSDVDQIGVTLVGLEFGEEFSESQVREWLIRRNVVEGDYAVEVCDGGIAVTRHSLPEDGSAHVKKVQIEPGVHAVIAATERNDVPVKLYRSVVEQAYGSYGWGHLNFASAQVDPMFTSDANSAIYVLQDVLENIILYSGLPLEDRKQLMRNALAQFGAYLEQMMDSLPRQAMDAGKSKRTDSNPGDSGNKDEAKDMAGSTQKTETKNETRKDENSEGQTPEYVTRDDLSAAIGAAIKEQVTPVVTEAVQAALAATRNDGASGEDAGNAQEGTGDTGDNATGTADTALLDEIKAMRADFTTRMDKVEQDLKEVSEGTFSRSDDEDGAPQDKGTGAAKRSDGPFSGMFDRSFGIAG
jgi:hypothetical protein